MIGRAALLALALAGSPAPSPSPSPTPTPTPTAGNEYRAVALAFEGTRLVLAGGGVLRVAADCTCARDVAGRAVLLTLDAGGNVVVLRRAAPADTARPAKDIPLGDYAFVPRSAEADVEQVTVTIDVSVPPQTPPTDNVYLSTERSGWNPAEVRLNRVDAVHFRAQLQLPAGARFAFRITRGSFSTGERDAAYQLPPAHQITAATGAVARIAVDHWADIN